MISSLTTAAVRGTFRTFQWQPLKSLSEQSRFDLIAKPLGLKRSNTLRLLVADTGGHPRWIEALWHVLQVWAFFSLVCGLLVCTAVPLLTVVRSHS